MCMPCSPTSIDHFREGWKRAVEKYRPFNPKYIKACLRLGKAQNRKPYAAAANAENGVEIR